MATREQWAGSRGEGGGGGGEGAAEKQLVEDKIDRVIDEDIKKRRCGNTYRMRKSELKGFFVLKVYVFLLGTKLNNELKFLHDIIGTVSGDFS